MELKYLDSCKCYRILTDCGGSPLGGGRWVDGGGGGYGCEGVSYACMHTHACTCTHTHACSTWPTWMPPCRWPFAISIHVYMCMRVCACMCVHVGTPPMPPDAPPPTCPLPRAAGSPKHQISITLELIEIIQFCLKILYPWTFLNSYRL